MTDQNMDKYQKIISTLLVVYEARKIVDDIYHHVHILTRKAKELSDNIIKNMRNGKDCTDTTVDCNTSLEICFIADPFATLVVYANKFMYVNKEDQNEIIFNQLQEALKQPEIRKLMEKATSCYNVNDSNIETLKQEIDKLKQVLTLFKMLLG